MTIISMVSDRAKTTCPTTNSTLKTETYDDLQSFILRHMHFSSSKPVSEFFQFSTLTRMSPT